MSGFGHSGPQRRVPQLRAGGAGGVRAVAHLRAARPGAVGLGPVVHGQPGRVLQQLAALLMAALLARKATGVGTDIDVSAVEAGVELIGPLMLDVAVNKRTHA